MGERQNIDHLIDWPDFYRQHIHSPMATAGRDKMHACCPFHQERNPSFWFNTKNGLWKCETGCGGGNATTFLAKIRNIDTKEAYRELCRIAGVDPSEQQQGEPRQAPKYTLKEYALEKRLPEAFLADLGVKDGWKQGWVEIPYMDETGAIVARRKRMPNGNNPRFLWNKGSKTTLYGLWRMDLIREAGYVVIVEGESDAQSLWLVGISALGMPGASTFREEHARMLMDVPKIYIHVEPDKGGETARRRTLLAFREAGYLGEARVFSCNSHKGIKDPSGLYIEEGMDAKGIIEGLMEASEKVNLETLDVVALDGLSDAPIQLRMPPGYEMTQAGIFKEDAKTRVMEALPFCWTPMLITKILTSTVGDVKVEIAFRRNGRWRTVKYPRAVLMVGRSITSLAEYGADASSENASALVKYLSALEQYNLGLIPQVKRAGQYGWHSSHADSTGGGSQTARAKDVFVPFDDGEYELDVDPAMEGMAVVGVSKGSFAVWRDAMAPQREHSLFRFLLASGFAPPLLKILGQRIFMDYNWGDSRGGKTVTTLCGLSPWGDPHAMVMSFNSTMVGIERTVGFFKDLPLGLNERQLAGTKQEYLEKIVYMLSEGKGKSRGAKNGGLQQQAEWRTVILANGEVELIGSASATGVSTRVLELYGRPFEDEDAAREMYDVLAQNYGHAGPMFIAELMKTNWDNLRVTYGRMQKDLALDCPAGSRSRVSSVAVVAVADMLAGVWIFGEGIEDAYLGAVGMAREIMGAQSTAEEDDANVKAHRYLVDWILSNWDQFTDSHHAQRYGRLEELHSEYMLIFPTVMRKALEDAGYSYGKTMRYLVEEGLVKTAMDGDRVRDTVRRRMGGARTWMVCFRYTQEAIQEANTQEELPFG